MTLCMLAAPAPRCCGARWPSRVRAGRGARARPPPRPRSSWTTPRRASRRCPRRPARADWVKSPTSPTTPRTWPRAPTSACQSLQAELAKAATRFDGVDGARRRAAPPAELLKLALVAARAVGPGGGRGAGAARRRRWRAPTARASTASRTRRATAGRAWTSTRSARSWPRAATRRSCSRPGRAGTRSRRPCARTTRATSSSGNKGARELGFADMGAHVAREVRHAARRLREGGRPALGAGAAALRLAARLRAAQAARAVRRGRWCRRRAPSPRTCSATCGRRSGATSTRWWRPPAPIPGIDLTARLKEKGYDAKEMVKHRRALLHLARLRAAAGDVLGALALHEAARPRGRLPRERLGHRPRGRPAHQDVHRDHGRGLPHHPPRARAQLLPARVQPAAVPLPRQRQRRLPRGDRRHHRALGHARVPQADRAHRRGAGRLEGHRPAAADGARQGRLPAVRPAGRPVALEGVRGRDHARELQRRVVGAAREVPGRHGPGRAQRGGLRPGRQVPRAGERALHALLPGAHPPVPVPPRPVPGGRLQGPAEPLLDLRQQGGGRAAAEDAGDGPVAGPGRTRWRR